jgi:hypothetical protein
MGQYETQQGGGMDPSTMQAAYDPLAIAQRDAQRKAILNAIARRKQQQPIEERPGNGTDAPVMLSEFGYSPTLRGVDNIEAFRMALKKRLAPYPKGMGPSWPYAKNPNPNRTLKEELRRLSDHMASIEE